ncbi:MAG: hypothetical protein UT05_C0003G0051 [Parcubacteria group bacterium GW2011_GWF2_38_76]|nr:MAG: hypothetical protein UT05_C0003G0051 [Parcubacteria group bacterium GW2011_GWF2_38_76]HBM46177.1 hypothetical protein [Patescibacteria group bacterium]
MENILIKYFGFKKILSIFPELYNYQQYAPLILRLSVGLIFLGDGWQDIKKKNGIKLLNTSTGSLKIISGLALVFGIYTQLWALVAGLLSLFNMAVSLRDGDWQKLKYDLLMLIITLSLLFSGPGLYAIDLPL